MPQSFDQTDLHTDSYSMTPSTTPAKSGLNANQKKMLGISVAAMLLGGAAWAVVHKPHGGTATTPGDDSITPGLTTTQLPADIDVAGKVNDTMSFEQAFEAARDEVGMGGVFGWHGRWYNTFQKEEWSSLSLEQRQSYTEMITGEKLPVEIYTHPIDNTHGAAPRSDVPEEPTIIEGHLNGQRVMGLDFDRDGIIDTLVMEGTDGYNYRIVDETGDEGLDTLFRYDSLNGELVKIEKIDEPFVLSNDQFSQGLEASMSKEVVNSILEPEVPVSNSTLPDSTETHDSGRSDPDDNSDQDDNAYLASVDEADDTYVNNGDVRDMDE